MDDNNSKNWRFCAVGNITAQHTDKDGNVYYGTKAFVGGTKVYIDDRPWDFNKGRANGIGLNRFKRYAVESVPTNLIENIRIQKVYKPTVLQIMSHLEALDGWPWRGRTANDRKELAAFVETLQNSTLK